jgi:exoribonuclease-2
LLTYVQRAGAIDSAYQFHYKRFLFENFPKGDTGFPALQAPVATNDLLPAAVRAFSIDDSATTEIDDALSVQGQALAHHAGHSHRRAWPGGATRQPD